MADKPRPLPVHLLTGFLGAGKTTLLNRALRKPELSNTAVIVNEFGDVALDHLLIKTGGEEIIELANGCLCCTVRGDLAEALARLADKSQQAGEPAIDRIVIETSGLADPLPVLQTVGALPRGAGRLVAGNVITVVNVLGGADRFDHHPEARAQLLLADIIVKSGTDIGQGHKDRAEIEKKIGEINSMAPLLDAHDNALEVAGLFDLNARHAPPGSAGHDTGSHQHKHGSRITALSIIRDEGLPENVASMFCDLLLSTSGGKILRLKAIVETPEDLEHPLAIHAAGGVLYPFERLPGWADSQRGTRIVIIGEDLDTDYINRMFDAFAGRPAVDTPDRDAVANNPLAIPGFIP